MKKEIAHKSNQSKLSQMWTKVKLFGANSLSNSTFSSRLGFTLAEVLITLGIVGIVAEMTIPVLVNNVTKEEYNAKIKDAYAVLAQAVIAFKANDIDVNYASKIDILDQFCNVLSCVTKDSDANLLYNQNIQYRYYGGGYKTDWPLAGNTGVTSALLKNGYYLGVSWNTAGCAAWVTECVAMIQVDVNGTKTRTCMGLICIDFIYY